MRKSFAPNKKFEYWEQRGVTTRVEIGARDVSRNQYIVADTANKVKHETGRMIAKRESVLELSPHLSCAPCGICLRTAARGQYAWQSAFNSTSDSFIRLVISTQIIQA